MRIEKENAKTKKRNPETRFVTNVAASARLSPRAVAALGEAMQRPEAEVLECFRELFV